MYHIRSA